MVEGTTAELQRHSFLEAPLLEIEKAARQQSLSHAGDTPALHLVIKISVTPVHVRAVAHEEAHVFCARKRQCKTQKK